MNQLLGVRIYIRKERICRNLITIESGSVTFTNSTVWKDYKFHFYPIGTKFVHKSTSVSNNGNLLQFSKGRVNNAFVIPI